LILARNLLTEFEFGDDFRVRLRVFHSEVREELFTAVHNRDETAAAVNIFWMSLEMERELANAVREKCDLNFAASCIHWGALEVLYDLLSLVREHAISF
jgi:hypothetical protein